MLTHQAARGASLMLAASLLGRIAALIAQVVTGLVLINEDFGVFAIAIGIQAIAGILQGGDALSYLVTLPPSRRRFRTGTVFGLCNGFYLIGVVPMLIFAPTIAAHFDEPRLVTLFWILAATMMLSPIRFVLRGRINARLAFGAIAKGTVLNNLVAYPLTIVLAIVLRDPTALALPVLLGAVAEVVYLWTRSKPNIDDFRPRRRFVMPLLHQFRWLITGAIMTSLFNQGDYMVAEFLVETAVLGTYFFGYQLAVQPGRLFTTTVLNILVPVVKRLSHDKVRLAAVLRRLLSTGGFAIAAVNLSMLAIIEPLEHLVWAEKWSDTIFTVQVLSVGLTYTTILGIGTSPLIAERRYRENVICSGLRAFAVVGGAAFGGFVWGSVNAISGSVAIAMTVAATIGTGLVLHWHGIPILSGLVHLFRSTVPLVLAAFLTAIIGHQMMEWLEPGRVSAAIALISAGIAYGVLSILSMAIIPADTRREVLRLLPAQIRRFIPASLLQPPTRDS